MVVPNPHKGGGCLVPRSPNQGNTRRLQQLSTFKMTRVVRPLAHWICRWPPPPSNSDHQVCYIFSRAFLETFIYHCCWEGIATRRCQPNLHIIWVISKKASNHVTTSLRPRKSCISVVHTENLAFAQQGVYLPHPH